MYNTPNLRNMAPWLTKRLRENEIGKGYLLNTGKLNAWDLPEFEVARNDMATERDLGLADPVSYQHLTLPTIYDV